MTRGFGEFGFGEMGHHLISIDFCTIHSLAVFIIVSVLLYSVICAYFSDDVSGFLPLRQ